MLLPNTVPGRSQRKLLKIFDQLDAKSQQMLLVYAEFLLSRRESDDSPTLAEEPIPQPTPFERPENESVIAAIKRLSKSYSMLNKDDMLHETSDLMSAHVLKGRAAEDVINELEALFIRHYERVCGADSDNETHK